MNWPKDMFFPRVVIKDQVLACLKYQTEENDRFSLNCLRIQAIEKGNKMLAQIIKLLHLL